LAAAGNLLAGICIEGGEKLLKHERHTKNRVPFCFCAAFSCPERFIPSDNRAAIVIAHKMAQDAS
jgi:hypothetical protein